MANVQVLTKKKANLNESLAKLTESTEATVAKLTEAHNKKIEELNTAHEAKVKAQRDGIVGKRERLVEQIAEVDAELQKEVGALQAQIDAIRGTATVKVAKDAEEDNGEDA